MDTVNTEKRKVYLDQLDYVELRNKDKDFILYGEKNGQAYAWDTEYPFTLLAIWPVTQAPPEFMSGYKQI